MVTFQIYDESTSTSEDLPLYEFELLGAEWIGESVALPFKVGEETRIRKVIGWTNSGQPCNVHIVRARWLPPRTAVARLGRGPMEPREGYLVWGGNSGVRILDPEEEQPFVWVGLEEAADLPPDVRAVVDA